MRWAYVSANKIMDGRLLRGMISAARTVGSHALFLPPAIEAMVHMGEHAPGSTEIKQAGAEA
jgi:hypothetical protein